MLGFTEIIVTLQIERFLDLLKGINDLVFLLLILREVKSLIAVPVDIPLRPVLIDMLTFPDVETAVIVLRVISAVPS